MFRKPKKKPAALRPTNNKGLNEEVAFPPNAKKRRRSHDDSSSDDGDKHHHTNDLLQQIRQERETSKSSKKQTINTSTTATAPSSKSKSPMHQFKSSNDQLTAKEMATRTAEHHPLERDKDDSTAPSVNQSLPSLQSNQPRNKFLAGPLKAPTFVRTTARFDYQPDICKDYKETGFCGFGDTCIYLHDRGDTKSGWEIEREYEEKKKREEERRVREVDRFMTEMDGGVGRGEGRDEFSEGEDAKDAVDDGIPFACHICRGPFKDPIVTTCNHYFCESCMSSRIKESGMGCPVCQKDTHGVLNFPQKLISKKRRLVGSKASWEEFLEKSRR